MTSRSSAPPSGPRPTVSARKTERSDALAADRAQLLEMGLDFHEHFGDQKCPVCGHGTLDANWAVAARAALEQEQQAAQSLTAARAATAQARSAVMAAVREVAAPPTADPDLTNLDAARATYDAFVKAGTTSWRNFFNSAF